MGDDPEENDAPVFTTRPVNEARVNSTYRYDLNVTDVDDDVAELEVEAPTLPSWAEFISHGNGSASLFGVPDATGDHPIDLLVRDGGGKNSTYSYFVYVRRAVVLKKGRKTKSADAEGSAEGDADATGSAEGGADAGEGTDAGEGADAGEG